MNPRYRLLVSALLLGSLSGCYTQLRAPSPLPRGDASSPPPPPGKTYPPRVDVRPYDPYPRMGLWDHLLYRPSWSQWPIRYALVEMYSGLWYSDWWLGNSYARWGLWNPFVGRVPALGDWHRSPPWTEPEVFVRRPRYRRAGFSGPIPSARELRGSGATVSATGTQPAGGGSRDPQVHAVSTPSQDHLAPPPPAPKPEQKKKDEEKDEKREAKRKDRKRRGGMK